MEIIQFVAESLGDASYVVVSGSEAAVVDPQRDVRPYLVAAASRGATIRTVFETHVHNDYVSGARELAARGAQVVVPADSAITFADREVCDGDEVAVGTAKLRAIFAPGHTHHHTAYLALDADGTVRGAFTGGSLIIGGAGRSDLLGDNETPELTRLQWESGRRIAGLLHDAVELLPTHGTGSFCSASSAPERRAALGKERPRNTLLSSPDFDSFRALHLANPGPIPSYYRHIAPINRAGPRVWQEPPRPPLASPADLLASIERGVPVIDSRPRFDFAGAHVPRSLSIEESDSFLAYVGWLTPFNSTLHLVTEDETQAERLTADLLRIGYEEVRGYLPFRAWTDEAMPTASIEVVDVAEAEEFRREGVPHLDVRFASEHRESPLPGARPLPFELIGDWLPHVQDQHVLLTCSAGSRATSAASALQARGVQPIVLVRGGADDLLAHSREHGHR